MSISIGPKGEEALPASSSLKFSPSEQRITAVSKEILSATKPLHLQDLQFSATPLTGINYVLAFVRDIMARLFGPSDKIAQATALLQKSVWTEQDFNTAATLRTYFPETRNAEAFEKAAEFIKKEKGLQAFKDFIEPHLEDPKALREALNSPKAREWADTNPAIKHVRDDLLKVFQQEDQAQAIKTAIGDLRRVDTPETRLNVGHHFLHQGNLAEAAKYLGESFEDLKDPVLILETAPLLIKAGKERIAIRLLKTIDRSPAARLQLFSCLIPTAYAGFFSVAKEGVYEGNLEEALLYRDPLSDEDTLALARLAFENNDFALAESLLRQNLYNLEYQSSTVKDAEAVLFLAYVYEAKGNRRGVLELVKLMETKGFASSAIRESARMLEAYAYIEGDATLPQDITKGLSLIKSRFLRLDSAEALRLAALATDPVQGAYLVKNFVAPADIPFALAHDFAIRFLKKGEVDEAFFWLKRSGDKATAQDFKVVGGSFKINGSEEKAAVAFVYALEKGKDASLTAALNDSLKTVFSSEMLRTLTTNDLLKLQKAYIDSTNQTAGLAEQIAEVIVDKSEFRGDFSGYVEIGRHLLAICDKKGADMLEELIVRDDVLARSKCDAALILIEAYLNGITVEESLSQAMKIAQMAYYGDPCKLVKNYVEKMGMKVPAELMEDYKRILLKTEYPSNPPAYIRSL